MIKKILLLLFVCCIITSCATKSFVRDECDSTLLIAKEFDSSSKIDVLRYADTIKKDVEALKKQISNTSEIRMNMYRDEYLRKIELLEIEVDRIRKKLEGEIIINEQ